MRISIIAAMDENRVIGKANRLPWHLPADLKHFRSLTLGKPIVMGRRTFDSLSGPLPGRTNIVVTKNRFYHADGCVLVHSLDDALAVAGQAPEVMIVGGAALYEAMLPRTGRLYLTLIKAVFAGDTRFPKLDSSEWRETERSDHTADEKNPHAYSFVTLDRISRVCGLQGTRSEQR